MTLKLGFVAQLLPGIKDTGEIVVAATLLAIVRAETVPADESSDDVRSSFQRPTPPHLATSGTKMPT